MNALQKVDTNIIDWSCQEQLKAIKEIYAKKATDQEFSIFVNLGKATGLNPFLKEIWFIKYADSSPASIFIARDGYRKSAQQNKDYDYHLSDSVYSNDSFSVHNGEVSHEYKINDRGNLVGAYCIVKRKSSSKPIFVFVELKEYDQNQSLWKTKKATMIKKCAEAQCLRMAFQELFANTYFEGEFEPQDNSKIANISRTTERVGRIIEGKKSNNIDEVLRLIRESKSLDELVETSKLTIFFTEEEKSQLRKPYKEKEIELKKSEKENSDFDEKTGEINAFSDDFEKIKKQLLNAKSKDILDVAADLISSVEEDKRAELSEIYNKRKNEVK